MAVDWGAIAETTAPIAGALIGGYAASQGDRGGTTMLLSGQSSGGSSSTTTSRSGLPEYLRKYLDAQGGIYPEAQSIYQRNMKQGYIGETPQQRALNQQMASGLQSQFGQSALNQNMANANNLATRYATSNQGVDPNQARSNMGPLDPTGALSGILSGQVDTRGLDALQQAAGNRAMVGYQDMVDDAATNFTQRVAPSIRSNSLLAGQYGGSRQGIAEGTALAEQEKQLARNARDLTTANMDIGTQLYGDAYNLANQQRYGAAQNLGQQALQNEQFNRQYGMAANAQNAALQQAGIGMQGQALNNYLTGMNTAYGALDRTRADQQMAQQFPWQQLGQYAGIVQRAPTESTSTGTSSSHQQSTNYTPVQGTGMTIPEGAGYGMAIGQGIGNWASSLG